MVQDINTEAVKKSSISRSPLLLITFEQGKQVTNIKDSSTSHQTLGVLQQLGLNASPNEFTPPAGKYRQVIHPTITRSNHNGNETTLD